MDTIRLLIADHHPIVRIGLRSVFSTQKDIQLLAEASNGDEALALAQRLKPNAILTEATIPGCSGRPMIRHLKRSCPDAAILVFSQLREEHHAIPMLQAGALGFINKARPAEDIIEAVRQVVAGEVFISRELSRQFTRAAFEAQALRAPHEHLSPREYEVFLKLVQDNTIGDIASQLHLSPKTVSTHKTRILQKLKLTSSTALVRYALEHELV